MTLQGPVAADSLQRAVHEVFARPEYQWVARRHPLQWLANWWLKLLAWMQDLSSHHPRAATALVWGCAILLVAILAHAGWVTWRVYRSSVRAVGAGATQPGGMRLEDARAHRRRAELLARDGRFGEALAHEFMAVILDLETAQALRFHPSKTPAEYVNEAQLDATGRATLAGLVARLYRHLFGAAPLDESAYRAFGADAQLVLQHVHPH